jgi:hypothetical protein
MKTSILAILATLTIGAAYSTGALARAELFSSAESAQAACPSEQVVWFQLSGRVYYTKTQTQFGGSGGVFACESVAKSKGYRVFSQ